MNKKELEQLKKLDKKIDKLLVRVKTRQSIIEVIDDFIKQETMIRTDDTIRLLVDLKKEIKLLK